MNRANVMIVAASPFQLALMADLLEANDITTVRKSSAAEALESTVHEPPTLVVVDLGLPGDQCQQIVQGLSKRPIPVMVVHEAAEREFAEQVVTSFRTGLASQVQKPIDTSMFPRKVIQEIRRHTTGVSRGAQV